MPLSRTTNSITAFSIIIRMTLDRMKLVTIIRMTMRYMTIIRMTKIRITLSRMTFIEMIFNRMTFGKMTAMP
jgi:hypothetical protein